MPDLVVEVHNNKAIHKLKFYENEGEILSVILYYG